MTRLRYLVVGFVAVFALSRLNDACKPKPTRPTKPPMSTTKAPTSSTEASITTTTITPTTTDETTSSERSITSIISPLLRQLGRQDQPLRCSPGSATECKQYCTDWPHRQCLQSSGGPLIVKYYACTCFSTPIDEYLELDRQSDLDFERIKADDDDALTSNLLLDVPMESFNDVSLEAEVQQYVCGQVEEDRCKNLCTKNGYEIHDCQQRGQKPTDGFIRCLCLTEGDH